MLKAVIFDMDGVIVDSEPQNGKAAVLTLAQYGIQASLNYCFGFIGTTTRHMFEKSIQDFDLSVTPEELESTYQEIKKKILKEEGYQPLPGVKALILDLYHHGVKLAIGSSSSEEEIKSVVDVLGLTDYFDYLISGTTLSQPKPSPDIFLKAMKELGVSAQEAIVIEDSTNGVLAASHASLPVIGFINKNSGKQDLSKASILIESFTSINFKFVQDTLLRANGEPITITTTDRLIIKELTVDDITQMYDIYHNPEVKKYIDDIDQYLETEKEKHKAYIKNIYNFYGYGLWGVFSKENHILIGRCGIQNQKINGREEIELSYLLDFKHWGYGYATECVKAILEYAFNTLEIHRIVAVIDKMNLRSIQVARGCGMTLEKEIYYKNRDCYLYVICNEGELYYNE